MAIVNGEQEPEVLPQTWTSEPYVVPASVGGDVKFSYVKMGSAQLADEIDRNPCLWDQFDLKFRSIALETTRRPLRKMSNWHLALALAAGQVSGVVRSQSGQQFLIKGGTHKEKVRTVSQLERCNSKSGGKCNCAYGVVFTFRGYQVGKMHNSGWKTAWKKAGLPTESEWTKGVHNLKHTFGRRLRAAGVPRETRTALLGHWDGNITTHYSAAEIGELIEGANAPLRTKTGSNPGLTLIKIRAATNAVTGKSSAVKLSVKKTVTE
ncbi:MAG TPA: hypothetical protein ENJ13_08460 [Chromatiales bacterium]|nr:hypothetical protein [Chromatiales bacterium]